MSVQDLFKSYFDVAFAAPDGVKRLRELILSVAMRGLLVPQVPSDRPASELLMEIEAEKRRLVEAGKIKKSKPLPEIMPDEVPYDLPDSWEWVKLGSIFDLKSGCSFSKEEEVQNGKYLYLKVGDMNLDKNSLYITHSSKYLRESKKVINSLIPKRSIIFPKRGGAIATNKKRIVKHEICVDTNIMCITPPQYIDLHFSYHWIQSINLASLNSGTSVPQINNKDIQPLLFPVPPLAEQKRIVEKIDRLMEQCDRLEQLRTEREQKRLTAHAAVNHRLLNAKDDRELQAAWGFIRDRFGELYAVKENVSELRKAILQLAVMGKLVPQDPRDRPASELLKEIQAEKQRLIKEGKIKKEKTLKTTNLSHIQILPENWEMARFSDILIDLKYGTSRKCDYIQNGFPVLRIPNLNVNSGKIDVTDLKYTQLTCQEIKDLSLTSGDLLVVRSNGSASLVGRPAIIDDNSQGFAYAGYLIRLRFFPQCIYSRYLYFALNTIFVRKQIEDPIRTTSGVKNINSKEINCLIIPLPPLPEQKRIVAKIDHLMHLCDQLETNITQQTTRQTQLLNAILANLNP